MSDLEYLGKVNPKPFISLAKEEKMRIDEIKRRRLNEKSGAKKNIEPVPELVYERDVQEDC
jgi:hypothetical protein